ncbi:MAG: hypothetical protein HFF66_06380 [Oscillospiraceae bacterium]|jgi:hypothetical protein|nr:hypothetical protein [Oscillospiraceae bacterium]
MKKVNRVCNWCLLLALAAGGIFTFMPIPPLLALLGEIAAGALIATIFLSFTRGIPMAGHRSKMLVFLLCLLPGFLAAARLQIGRAFTIFLLLLTPVYYSGIFGLYNRIGCCPACGKRIPLFSDSGQCPSCHAAVDLEESPS